MYFLIMIIEVEFLDCVIVNFLFYFLGEIFIGFLFDKDFDLYIKGFMCLRWCVVSVKN